MKLYIPFKSIFFWIIILSLFFTACEKEEPDPDPDPGLPEETLVLNNWIWEGMNDLYLWEEFLPNIDPKYEEDPMAYFYKLLYQDDQDSWIVDDYEALVASFDGVQLTNGMSLDIQGINGTVVFLVEYVYPDSPAADSGIIRGELILSVDGQAISEDNYRDLYFQASGTFGFGSFDGINLIPGKVVELASVELNSNPFVHHEIIEYQGSKIGYYVYTDFAPGPNAEWLDEMDRILGDFKTAGVTDVVVDLRYNPGGYGYVAEKMGNILAPQSVISKHRIFSTRIWNDGFTQFWKETDLNQDGLPDGDESSRLITRFQENQVNLDLSKVHFLTTRSSASSSELLIVALDPYMEVVQIGTTSYGKCYGSVTVDDWETPKRHNWAMQPIVLKYANSEGFTDFTTGLVPDHIVEENLYNAPPFGSMQDPLLAEALKQITGVAPTLKKSADSPIRFQKLAVPRIDRPDIELDRSVLKEVLASPL